MYRNDYQNQLDTLHHQQQMQRYAQRSQLVRMTSRRPQRPWMGVLNFILSIFVRS